MTQYDYKVDSVRQRLKAEELDRQIESYYADSKMVRTIYMSGLILIKYKDPNLHSVEIFEEPIWIVGGMTKPT